jgi:peptidoglycan/LPS O-acetylase OafA/YrhL
VLSLGISNNLFWVCCGFFIQIHSSHSRILAEIFQMNDLSENNKPLYFVQLDSLRFLAAFMIVFYHAFESWVGWYGIPWRLATPDGKNWNLFGDLFQRFNHNLAFGVDIFFLISGFLITYLLLKEKSEKGKINIPNFFLRRIFRIWPLYFFIVAIAPFLVHWLGSHELDYHAWLAKNQPDYKSTILFYNNFHSIGVDKLGQNPWTFPFSHFWSVNIEEHFYLVWPFLVSLFSIRRLPIALVGIILASIAYRAYAFYFIQDHSWFPIYMHTLARIDVLAIGGLVAWFHFKKPFTLNIAFRVRVLIFCFLIFMLTVTDLSLFDSFYTACFKKYVCLALAGILMMCFVFNPRKGFVFGPKHVFSYLGRCSYGIYMWGNIILPLVIPKFLQHFSWGGHTFQYWSVVIGTSLLVPVITYELIEKPFLKLKSRFAIIKTRL